VSKIASPSLPRCCDTQFQEMALSRRSSLAESSEWPAEELARIRMVLRKLTALRIENPEDAEDLVQETLLTMIEKWPEIELRKGLLVWGMGILRKKVGNYYRREQRYSAMRREFLSDVMLHLTRSPPAAESTMHYRELRALVDAILEKFPTRERAVMELLVSGLPINEIAGALHPERYQNIVNRVHRGRKRLHKELAKYGYGVPDARKVRKQACRNLNAAPVPGA
jgi:RNA polymerase sigma factor (sigma-70 family)